MRKAVVGFISLLIVFLLDPIHFPDWLQDTVLGIFLSSLFFRPLAGLMSGKFDDKSLISLITGLFLFTLYTFYMFGGDLVQSAKYLFEWLAIFSFVSVVFQEAIMEVESWMMRKLR